MNSNASINFFLLSVCGAVWGSSFIVIAIALEQGISPTMVAATRTLIGGFSFLVLALVLRRSLPSRWRDWGKGLLIGLFNIALPFYLISAAQATLSAANASILISTVPIFTLLFTPIIGARGEHIDMQKMLGVALGFVGVVMVLWPDVRAGQPWLPGIMVLASAACYAISGHLTKRIGQMGPVAGNAVIFVGSSLWMFPLAMFLEPASGDVLLEPILWYLGIFPTAMIMYIRFILLQRTSASYVSMVSYLIPCFAVLWQWIFFSEYPHWMAWAGFVVVMIGVAKTQSSRSQ